MEIYATSKSVRVSPRKIRLIADAVRHMSIQEALVVLEQTRKRAGVPVFKTLKSAVANAVNNAKLDPKDLVIGSIMVSDGPALKRFRPSTRGRIHPYKKRSTNIKVMVKDVVKEVSVKTEPKKVDGKKETEETKGGKK